MGAFGFTNFKVGFVLHHPILHSGPVAQEGPYWKLWSGEGKTFCWGPHVHGLHRILPSGIYKLICLLKKTPLDKLKFNCIGEYPAKLDCCLLHCSLIVQTTWANQPEWIYPDNLGSFMQCHGCHHPWNHSLHQQVGRRYRRQRFGFNATSTTQDGQAKQWEFLLNLQCDNKSNLHDEQFIFIMQY